MIGRKLQQKNEYSKFENSQPQIENTDYTNYKIKINEIKQYIIRKFPKVGWLVGWLGLWHINCVGYLMPNPFLYK